MRAIHLMRRQKQHRFNFQKCWYRDTIHWNVMPIRHISFKCSNVKSTWIRCEKNELFKQLQAYCDNNNNNNSKTDISSSSVSAWVEFNLIELNVFMYEEFCYSLIKSEKGIELAESELERFSFFKYIFCLELFISFTAVSS